MINKNKAYAYFEKNHGPLIKSTNGWFTGICPFCGHPKLAVNFDYLHVKCWRGCHRGFIVDFIRTVENVKYFEVYELLESYPAREVEFGVVYNRRGDIISEVQLPNGFKTILQGETGLGIRARKYMNQRGFDIEYLDRIGVGYCNEHNPKQDFFGYIIVPFKIGGKLVYFIGRDFVGNYPRYKNPEREQFGIGKSEVFFNEEALHLFDKIYQTEGWTDACTMGPQGISIQGNSISDLQLSKLLMSNVKEIVIALDVGFYKQALHIASKLINHKKIKVLKMDLLKDFGKDVNEIGIDRVLSLEDVTPQMGFKTLYKELRHVA